jgi:outer membrane protein assembly factor BamB
MSSPRLLPLLAACAGLLFARLAAAEPTAVPPPPDPIEGVWLGHITAPQGTRAEFGLEFFRNRRGVLAFKLWFPDMFTYGAAPGMPVEADGHGGYRITPAFDLVLQREGDDLRGTFGGARLPVELRRGGRLGEKPAPVNHPAAPAPRWTCDLGAPTWATPVATEGVVYIGTDAGDLLAIDAADGHPRWRWAGGVALEGRVVVDTATLYCVDAANTLLCLDRRSGELRWRTALHDAALAGGPAPRNPTFNHRTATPLLLEGVLYVGSGDGGLYAVRAADGEKLWRHDARAPVFSGVGRLGADGLAFGTMDGSVVVLDRKTRRETLRVRTGGGVVTTPVLAGDRLVVGSRDYLLYGFAPDDGRVTWRYSYWFSWIESTPAARDGLLYVGASDYARVTALDPADGRARWSTPVGGMCWGTPAVTDDLVFIGTVAQNLPGTLIAHEGGLVALDRATGAVRWRRPAPPAAPGGFGGYAGSLAVTGDLVIAAGFDGRLVALPLR